MTAPNEETLDPHDWEQFRALAHRMVDDTIDHLEGLRDDPAWREMPREVRDSFDEPVPMAGEGEEAVYRDFLERVRPYPNGNLGPRFWGWVQGNGTPLAMMAEMLAAALNPHMAGFNQAPALVEDQVIDWLRQLMGFPAGASGLLVSSGTMGNLLGLAVARGAVGGALLREGGMRSLQRPLAFYGSRETHGWASKAAELLGLGRDAFRQIPTGRDYRVDLERLGEALRADRAAGLEPFCVVATAGTVNTGAIDDLEAIADLCEKERLWLHVDGAFGAFARLAPELAALVRGLERADSLAFDLHKWGYLPFEAACLLVRDAAAHRETFRMRASYLAQTTRGVAAGGLPYSELGIDLTRSFRALKVWMTLRAYGVEKLGRLVAQNVAQARYLGELVNLHPELELLAPVSLNVVCFRYSRADLGAKRLDAINQEILLRVQEEGIAVPSGTLVEGRYAIRVANVNHRSRRQDFERLAEAVARIGGELAGED